jgi:hypothetical protein
MPTNVTHPATATERDEVPPPSAEPIAAELVVPEPAPPDEDGDDDPATASQPERPRYEAL